MSLPSRRSRILSVPSEEAVTRLLPEGWNDRQFTPELCTKGQKTDTHNSRFLYDVLAILTVVWHNWPSSLSIICREGLWSSEHFHCFVSSFTVKTRIGPKQRLCHSKILAPRSELSVVTSRGTKLPVKEAESLEKGECVTKRESYWVHSYKDFGCITPIIYSWLSSAHISSL